MDYSTIKQQIQRSFAPLSVLLIALGLGACEVKKTQEGEMPEVKVEGGQVPKYDVEGPEVNVEKEKKTITVPDVDIVTPEEKRQGGNVENEGAGVTAPATEPATPPASNPTP